MTTQLQIEALLRASGPRLGSDIDYAIGVDCASALRAMWSAGRVSACIDPSTGAWVYGLPLGLQ